MMTKTISNFLCIALIGIIAIHYMISYNYTLEDARYYIIEENEFLSAAEDVNILYEDSVKRVAIFYGTAEFKHEKQYFIFLFKQNILSGKYKMDRYLDLDLGPGIDVILGVDSAYTQYTITAPDGNYPVEVTERINTDKIFHDLLIFILCIVPPLLRRRTKNEVK